MNSPNSWIDSVPDILLRNDLVGVLFIFGIIILLGMFIALLLDCLGFLLNPSECSSDKEQEATLTQRGSFLWEYLEKYIPPETLADRKNLQIAKKRFKKFYTLELTPEERHFLKLNLGWHESPEYEMRECIRMIADREVLPFKDLKCLKLLWRIVFLDQKPFNTEEERNTYHENDQYLYGEFGEKKKRIQKLFVEHPTEEAKAYLRQLELAAKLINKFYIELDRSLKFSHFEYWGYLTKKQRQHFILTGL